LRIVGGASVAAILWRGPGRRRPAAPPAVAGLGRSAPGPASGRESSR